MTATDLIQAYNAWAPNDLDVTPAAVTTCTVSSLPTRSPPPKHPKQANEPNPPQPPTSPAAPSNTPKPPAPQPTS